MWRLQRVNRHRVFSTVSETCLPHYWRVKEVPEATTSIAELDEDALCAIDAANTNTEAFLFGSMRLFEGICDVLLKCPPRSGEGAEAEAPPAENEVASAGKAAAAASSDSSDEDEGYQEIEFSEVADAEFLKQVLHPKLHWALTKDPLPAGCPKLRVEATGVAVLACSIFYNPGARR